VPSHLNSRQKKALKDFSDACTTENYPMADQLRRRTEDFFKAKETLNKTKTES
jgi:hypothetical protein